MACDPTMPLPDRVAAVTLAGWRPDGAPTAHAGLHDSEPAVRVAALGALARLGQLDAARLDAALDDPDPRVRRRACELGTDPTLDVDLSRRLADDDPFVGEAAAYALGERRYDDRAVEALIAQATSSPHALVREAAVAALGSLAAERALPVILRALDDVVTVRRRAVLALAPFDAPEVEAALERAAADRDWQVRNAAVDLLAYKSA